MTEPGRGPLSGIRVIDVGTRISAPFCAGLLGELGADVIKVELPGQGDFMRSMGPFVPTEDGPGYSLSWAVEGRGRRGVTCDLRQPEGKELFTRLMDTADVLCENFRPGTMERWGLGPDDLPPGLVYVRISAFGQTGPYAPRPGLDRLGIAYGGLLNLTGEPDRPPVRSGVNISDYLTGTFAAFAAVAALYGRDAGGEVSDGEKPQNVDEKGEVIDAALYGSIMRILEWTLPGYDRLGLIREREGNRLSTSAPLDNYPTADGTYVCIVAGSDANFARLCAAMGRPELQRDPRFSTLAERAVHGDEINGVVTAWTSGLTAEEVSVRCVEHDVPVATAYSAAEIFADPHMEARGDLVSVDDPVIGAVRQQAPFPRLRGYPAPVPSGAPQLGEHNHEVWCGLLGVSDAELEDLTARGIV
jgi:crotonobetainyl-CoA:carnitine CoA-transferase CaiB-like acyl-CoA transferase